MQGLRSRRACFMRLPFGRPGPEPGPGRRSAGSGPACVPEKRHWSRPAGCQERSATPVRSVCGSSPAPGRLPGRARSNCRGRTETSGIPANVIPSVCPAGKLHQNIRRGPAYCRPIRRSAGWQPGISGLIAMPRSRGTPGCPCPSAGFRAPVCGCALEVRLLARPGGVCPCRQGLPRSAFRTGPGPPGPRAPAFAWVARAWAG